MARRQLVTARLNESVGASLPLPLPVLGIDISAERDVHRRLGQIAAEAALEEFRDDRTLELVALVQEGKAEGKADVAENFGVFRPGDDGARAHHGRDVAVDESLA